MFVRITGFSHPQNWYAAKIGEIFEVEEYIPGNIMYDNHYRLKDESIYMINKNNCVIVKPELFSNLYEKLSM